MTTSRRTFHTTKFANGASLQLAHESLFDALTATADGFQVLLIAGGINSMQKRTRICVVIQGYDGYFNSVLELAEGAIQRAQGHGSSPLQDIPFLLKARSCGLAIELKFTFVGRTTSLLHSTWAWERQLVP